MAPQSLSIQSFFPRVAPRECTITVPGAASATGSTGSTVETVDDPKHESAKIRATYQHYPKVQIGELDPGPPRAIALRGRIVNVSEPPSTPRKPQAAKGHLRIILQDDTGALVVRVWFATRDYRLHLGRLCSVWTTHVCMGQSSSITPSAPLETSIFPERDSSCYLMTEDEDIEDTSLCRTPLGHCEGRFDPSLVNLRDYLNKGYENSDSKILVCVKGVGARKKFTNKRGRVSHKVEVGVFDDSAEAKLTLWGVATGSAIDWQAAQTVILLSGPAIQAGECSTLSLKNCTHADVDPLMKGAEVLRRWAQGLTGKQIVNASLPHDAPETENILGREERILYTLGELNEFARLHPGEQLTAYLSVVMSAPNFTRLRAGNRLFCGECCGILLYGNTSTGHCKSCDKDVPFQVNPRCIGPFHDESGTLFPHELLWSATAWSQLFGRSPSELAASPPDLLGYIEGWMAWMRVSLKVRWDSEARDKEGRWRLKVLNVEN